MGSIIGILLLSPVFIVLILALYFLQHKQVFFCQPRVGLNDRVFTIFKFKTMNDATDVQGKLLPDTLRTTRLGKWLRSTSLDELPQFFNVLKGDMSFVGPRPLLTSYAHLYSDFQKKRHAVKPGITGYVQVKGRNALTWAHRFELDVYYVTHISFVLDCKIVFLTLIQVFHFKSATTSGTIPMEPFEGYE